MKLYKLVVLLVVLVGALQSAKAQNLLDKKISYSAQNISLKQALGEISQKFEIPFSYSESIIPADRKISIEAVNATLSAILEKILPPSIDYKELSGQIVLSKKRKPSSNKTHTISGYVKEKGSGESLIGVNIFVQGTTYGTSTNAYGFFSITLPGDFYEITFSYIGYKTIVEKATLNKDIELDINLEGAYEVSSVEIKASSKLLESSRSQMSTIEIPIDQIKDIPALLGEKDVLKVVQLMPGVQTGNEGQSGFYVRGGGPDQNLIILDGAPVYNAFHLFGFFSLFNGDALKSVELIKGGFPSRYGGRLSSVLDLHMKDGHQEEFHGEVGVGLISSRFTFEGPIKKKKSSFIISGRRTYIDALIRPFLPKEERAGYYFYDLNAKVNYDFGKKDKVYLSGYFGRDRFYAKTEVNDNTTDIGFEWGNATATARWNHQFNNKLFANASAIFSNYRFLVSAEETNANGDFFNLRFYSQIRDYSLKYDLDYYPGNGHHIKMGAVTTLHEFTPSAFVFKNSFGGDNIDNKRKINGIESGLYIEDDMRLGKKFKVNAGMRVSHFTNRDKHYVFPEPRISGAYQLGKNMAVKSSFAIMNQYMHLISNTGVGLPTDLWVPSTSNVPPQRSMQLAAGIVKDLVKQDLTVSVEGYYKEMYNILGYKEGATFLTFDDPTATDGYAWEENVTSGKGWSYGAEFLLQKKRGRFSGWIGYTLSWTQLQFDELNFGEKFWARYDRRHDASVVGIYKITENISVSTTWVYGTGQAITLPLANYNGVFDVPGNSNTNTNMQTQLTDYGKKNNFRMAPYHRMDIGLRMTKVKPKYSRTIELSFYNIYNRKNPFFYYAASDGNGITRLKQITLFPIIPSISISYKF